MVAQALAWLHCAPLGRWLQVEEKLGEHLPEHVLTKQTELITDDLGAPPAADPPTRSECTGVCLSFACSRVRVRVCACARDMLPLIISKSY